MIAPTTVAFALVLVSSSGFSPSSTHRSRSDLQAAKKIFIDGEAGTTGLQVRERLAKRDDLEILSIADDLRKDVAERKRLINEADCVILCLPDAASIEVRRTYNASRVSSRVSLIDFTCTGSRHG